MHVIGNTSDTSDTHNTLNTSDTNGTSKTTAFVNQILASLALLFSYYLDFIVDWKKGSLHLLLNFCLHLLLHILLLLLLLCPLPRCCLLPLLW